MVISMERIKCKPFIKWHIIIGLEIEKQIEAQTERTPKILQSPKTPQEGRR
jgi:hypothetical protein